jgi:hypothetical protein
MILMANRQEVNRIKKFRVLNGDTYDFLPATNRPGSTLYGQLIGQLPGGEGDLGGLGGWPGFVGEYGPWDVVQEDMLPAGYLVGLASGGPMNPDNPVGLREHEHPDLRGLKLIPQFERYPLRESFYHHAVGSGIRHRGAAVVMQVTAGSYAVPSFVYGGPGDFALRGRG